MIFSLDKKTYLFHNSSMIYTLFISNRVQPLAQTQTGKGGHMI